VEIKYYRNYILQNHSSQPTDTSQAEPPLQSEMSDT
jgi:hypothetical protein